MTTLFDQAAREAIAHDLDHTLFVEAGAGTGKTSALVARLAALVRRGASLTQIAAITFTEAAAAELRERVREALGFAAASGEPGADRCADALAHFDDTTISTLHAFAQRVLSEFPVRRTPPRPTLPAKGLSEAGGAAGAGAAAWANKEATRQ